MEGGEKGRARERQKQEFMEKKETRCIGGERRGALYSITHMET